jgi:DNA-binding HxlR family transcriptional regulator
MSMSTITKEKCPVEAVSAIISRKWVCLILRDLEGGPKRFGELEHSVKASPRILSARLQELEAEGLISRQAFAEIPPRTEYRLTDKGKLLIPVIHSMREVGKEFI